MNSVTTENQELQHTISSYFKNTVGNFLDIGAGDGETNSFTRSLALQGWVGLLCESDPHKFSKLETVYYTGQYQLMNYAIGPYIGVPEIGIKNHLSSTTVKMITSKLLMEYSIIRYFDFISIRGDGHDISILQGLLPFLRKTEMISLEYNNIAENRQQIVNLLPNFKEYAINHTNIVLVK